MYLLTDTFLSCTCIYNGCLGDFCPKSTYFKYQRVKIWNNKDTIVISIDITKLFLFCLFALAKIEICLKYFWTKISKSRPSHSGIVRSYIMQYILYYKNKASAGLSSGSTLITLYVITYQENDISKSLYRFSNSNIFTTFHNSWAFFSLTTRNVTKPIYIENHEFVTLLYQVFFYNGVHPLLFIHC